MEIINLEENKKAYFSSDNHLGLPGKVNSLKREKIFIKWLDSIKDDAQVIFLLMRCSYERQAKKILKNIEQHRFLIG